MITLIFIILLFLIPIEYWFVLLMFVLILSMKH